jgi:hypothetical protein
MADRSRSTASIRDVWLNLVKSLTALSYLAARGESRAEEVVCGGEGSTGLIERVQFFAWRWENEDTKSREGCGWR